MVAGQDTDGKVFSRFLSAPPRVMAEMAQEALCALARGCPSVKTCGMEGGGRGSTARHTPCRFQRQQGTLEGLDVPRSGKLPTGPESRQCPKSVKFC